MNQHYILRRAVQLIASTCLAMVLPGVFHNPPRCTGQDLRPPTPSPQSPIPSSDEHGRAQADTDDPQSSTPSLLEAEYDVVVYGGTSGGVAAALAVRQMGKSVALIESGQHLGGLTSGGLGATDIGNKRAIGGISREFYRRVKKHYEHPAAWRQERADQFRSDRQAADDDAMWTFEPHVAEAILRDMVREAGVDVFYEERLDLKHGVVMRDREIESITTESGRTFRARRFIDASYEGDLLALAGVKYHVGRESNDEFGETLNGVQTKQAVHHQFMPGVDPYVVPGDPSSGLLPGVHDDGPGEEGSGDRRVQTYNLRMCLTDDPENRIPFAKPEGYDPLRYELLLRNFAAGETRIPWSPTRMPNRKTDTNNNYGFSTDNIGKSYDWPEGDYATREALYRDHLLYQQGLMWTLANNARVPEAIRREVSRWGNCKDEFAEHGGWSHQLYVREARRMVSDYVMTQHDCQGRRTAEDPVGLAAYTMDSHHVQRYVDAESHVKNEGDVQVGGFPPYPISYRSIVPAADQCENLLVPVCLSASHIAYGSIRMEPVFMVLGQSAGTAACLSIDEDVPVQRLRYELLQKRLLDDGQVLSWDKPGPRGAAIDPKKLKGLVIDDTQATRKGEWVQSSAVGPFVNVGYLHDNDADKGTKEIRFAAKIEKSGTYEVRLAYSPHENRATNVPVTVHDADGETTVKVDQRKTPPLDGAFVSLGVFRFEAGAEAVVIVTTGKTNGYVIADAVQIVPVDE